VSAPNTVVTGSSKTGTTGLYNAVWDGLSTTTGGRCYGLREQDDLALLRNLRRMAPDRTLAAKYLLTSSGFRDELIAPFDRHLMTVRDPRDTLLSVALFYPIKAVNAGVEDERIARFVDLVRRKEQDPASVSFFEVFAAVHQLIDRTVEPSTVPTRRFRVAIHHAKKHDPHVVHYERFIRDDLGDVSDLLGFEVRNARPTDYTSLVFRSGGAGEWRHWFTERDVEIFRPKMARYMEQFGYEDDWELAEAPQVDPENGSGYVTASIAKRQRQRALSHGQGAVADQLQYLREQASAGSVRAATRLADRLLEDAAAHAVEIRGLLEFASAAGSHQAMHRLVALLEEGPAEVRDLGWAQRWRAEIRAAQALRELRETRAELSRLRSSKRVQVADALAAAGRGGPAAWGRLPKRVRRILADAPPHEA
jgi:hypothetical protein